MSPKICHPRPALALLIAFLLFMRLHRASVMVCAFDGKNEPMRTRMCAFPSSSSPSIDTAVACEVCEAARCRSFGLVQHRRSLGAVRSCKARRPFSSYRWTAVAVCSFARFDLLAANPAGLRPISSFKRSASFTPWS